MKPQLTLALLAIDSATLATADAAVITSSFGSTTGLDNDNQAGPLRGVTYKIITTGTYTNPTTTGGASGGANSYTATHALSASDETATTVLLTNLTWQTSSTSAGFSTSPLYVSVFSGLTVNTTGVVTALGTFVGSSSNSIASPSEPMPRSLTTSRICRSPTVSAINSSSPPPPPRPWCRRSASLRLNSRPGPTCSRKPNWWPETPAATPIGPAGSRSSA